MVYKCVSVTKSKASNFSEDNTQYSCNKDLKWGVKSLLDQFNKSGTTKFHFVVLETGKANSYNLLTDGVR